MKTSCYRLMTLGAWLLALGVSIPARASNDYTALSINDLHPTTAATESWGSSGAYYYWYRDGSTIYLRGSGPYEISGTDIAAARFHIEHDCEIIIKIGLQIDNAAVDYSPIECNGHNVTLRLGDGSISTFTGGGSDNGHAGINVPYGSTLNITNLKSSVSLTATGKGCAAGIGGNYQEDCGTINISGGMITATGNSSTSGEGAAGIGGGYQGAGGTVNVYGGTVTAIGAAGAGIGGGELASGGTINIYGGTVNATGTCYGAGIGGGGGAGGNGGTVNIYGGTVTAKGGTLNTSGGAGIGGGCQGVGARVTITNGTVIATGGYACAGIGGGDGNYGVGGTVTVSGGTVIATGDWENGAEDIGYGKGGNASGANTFTGGSIRLTNGTISRAPSNGTVRVWCVTFLNVTSASALADLTASLAGLSPAYGVNGIVPLDGKVYAWLPDGDYSFATGSGTWRATVNGADTTASCTIGVTVNGTDIAARSGTNPAWTYDDGTNLALTASGGAYVISGSNGIPFVSIQPQANCTVVASNLFINASVTNASALFIGTNSYVVTLLLAGTNTLVGGGGSAGISIEKGSGSLMISNLEASATLVAKGGSNGAGIGGGYKGACGTVNIYGGIVTATGTYYGAGIGGGGGAGGNGGTVNIYGGTVTANGGTWDKSGGAGIGGGSDGPYGSCGNGGTVNIYGGIITATGGYAGAGIGGCVKSGDVTILITGGTITATGGLQGAGIGSGLYSDANPHTQITITGGTVNATGGDYGAGIGGGWYNNYLDISISGGTITAHGGYAGAGIGTSARDANMSYDHPPHCVITISGGRITAMGGDVKKYQGGAGIGGGAYTYADVTISGGTIVATRGSINADSPCLGGDIGWGGCPSGSYTDAEIADIKSSGKAVFIGGSIHATQGLVINPPVWYGKTLFCVPVTGLAPNAAISLTPASESLSYYGTKDIYSDAAGTVYLWLPPGDFLLAPSPAAAGSTSATNLSTIAVKSSGAFTTGSTPLRITGFDGSSVTNWLPTALSSSHAETLYATNLTAAAVEWKGTNAADFAVFTNAPAIFMKLHVK